MKLYILTAVALIWTTINAHAQQQAQCAPRDNIMSQLEEKYAEVPIIMGMTNAGTLMEITANADKSSYTVTITRPDGITCLMGAGENLEILPTKEAKPKGEDM